MHLLKQSEPWEPWADFDRNLPFNVAGPEAGERSPRRIASSAIARAAGLDTSWQEVCGENRENRVQRHGEKHQSDSWLVV